MLPNFLVIGAPRAGTTWIEKNLREHPEVFLPTIKEIHFFDSNYEEGLDWYRAFFANAAGKKAIGEATPDYMHGAYTQNDVPGLIHRHLPDIKLIVSIRNPVERAYSRFWNSKARFDANREKTFEDKLSDSPEFIAEGMYYDHLRRYYSVFRRDQILVLLFDELVNDPQSFMCKIYRFLGVREDVKSGWESIRVNQSAGKGNLAKSRLLHQVYRALTWLRLHSLASYVHQLNSVKLEPMSKETERLLLDIYREQIVRLGELIGQNLDHWIKQA